MYEPHDPERSVIRHFPACDNETLEIITPECDARDAPGRASLPVI